MRNVSYSREECARGLRACVLFDGLAPEVLDLAAGLARGRVYDVGEVLFLREAPADGFHVILEGRVKICRYGADGREQVLHILGPGETCGEAPVFEGGCYPATAEATVPVRTLYLAREGFLAAGREHPELLTAMLGVLSRRLRHFVQLADDLALKEVGSRLSRRLLHLAGSEGLEVDLDMSKALLASRLGTVAETLSRSFAKLQRQGAIEVHGRCITILDRARLEDLAESGPH